MGGVFGNLIAKNSTRILRPLQLLMLLIMAASIVTAQSIDDGFTQSCGLTSVKLEPSPPTTDVDNKFQSLMQPFKIADAERRLCPDQMVCAQKLVSIQDFEARYSEECWRPYSIIEYTEISCYSNFCNTNITFGQIPNLPRRYFSNQGSPISCYNHGQLLSASAYRQIVSPTDYEHRTGHPVPVSRWSGGLCGAAIYASMGRSSLIHERVLTGDREQKFAILRLCPSSGCNRQLVRDYLDRGYGF